MHADSQMRGCMDAWIHRLLHREMDAWMSRVQDAYAHGCKGERMHTCLRSSEGSEGGPPGRPCMLPPMPPGMVPTGIASARHGLHV